MSTYSFNTQINTGTAQAGGASTITLASGASSVNDTYNGCSVTITSGLGSGQTRLIISYVGSTRVATVDTAWSTNPDNTSVYSVKEYPTYVNGQTVATAERENHKEQGIQNAHSELTTHQSSSDHDTHNDARYLGITAKAADADKLDNMNPATTNAANSIVQRDANGDFAARIVTAALTGNVTGNCSGSSGSCTGNAATATSATNASNADKVDNCDAGTGANNVLKLDGSGKVPAANGDGVFMQDAKTYGTVTKNDLTIGVGATGTWIIPLGGTFRHGQMFMRNTNNGALGYSGRAMYTFGTDASKSMSMTNTTSSEGTRIYHRSFDSVLSQSGISDVDAPSGKHTLDVQDVYLSGTNLLVVFKNSGSATLTTNCTAYYEVWA